MGVILFNGVQINKAAVKDMSYTEFCKVFKNTFTDRQIDNAAKACGIKKKTKSIQVESKEETEG